MSDSAWIPGHRLYSIDTSSWPPGAPVPETDWSADLSWFTYLPSPDGRRVAYWKEMDPFQDEINVVGLGSEKPVAPTPIHPTPTAEEPTDFVLWSPDGSSIYFVLVMSEVNTRRILRTRFDDQGPLPMESLTAPGHISDVKLSADGARLAFVQYESPDSDAGDLWVVDVSGPTPGAPERLTNLAAFGGGVAYNGGRQFHFTADSRHVVYAAGERAGGAAEAFVVNVDGPATPRRLHPDPPSADSYVKQIWLSPDTSVVVLNAELETPGRMEAFALRLAADVPSALTKLNGPLRSGEEVYGIDWSGDGRSIAVSVGLPEPRTLRIEIATDDGLRFHAGVPVSAPEHEAYRPQFVAERRGE
jgi:hypothetical protein